MPQSNLIEIELKKEQAKYNLLKKLILSKINEDPSLNEVVSSLDQTLQEQTTESLLEIIKNKIESSGKEYSEFEDELASLLALNPNNDVVEEVNSSIFQFLKESNFKKFGINKSQVTNSFINVYKELNEMMYLGFNTKYPEETSKLNDVIESLFAFINTSNKNINI